MAIVESTLLFELHSIFLLIFSNCRSKGCNPNIMVKLLSRSMAVALLLGLVICSEKEGALAKQGSLFIKYDVIRKLARDRILEYFYFGTLNVAMCEKNMRTNPP